MVEKDMADATPHHENTFSVVLAQDYDYLSAGIAYRATPEVQRTGKAKGKILSVRLTVKTK
jgi:hypothetical protein